MMVGLPGDDETGALTTAQRIADLAPDFVRIYPTLVVANSRLAGWYKSGDYAPLSLEEGVRAPELLNSTKDQLVLSYNNKQLDS
jgi:histone acetyltransferase (RNA polymerase elongator complex component)